MKLYDIFKSLTYGELSNLAIGNVSAGEISDVNYVPIMNHINMGLTALYTRFKLKENSFVLALQDTQVTYSLLSQYAVSNTKSKELVRYIEDSTFAPFKDDILKIYKVLTPAGIPVSLNMGYHPYTCTTPTANILRVPPVLVDGSTDLPEYLRNVNKLTVMYQANHVMLDPDMGSFDPTKIEMELPQSHLQALLYFVASRVNNPIGLGQEFNAGNTYAAKYERECQLLEAKGMEIDEDTSSTKFSSRGFV